MTQAAPSDFLHVSQQGGVAILTLMNPPVNALCAQLRGALMAAIAQATADRAVTAVILIGAGRGFSAGADISEFGAAPIIPRLAEVCALLEACPKPVIAAMDGFTLGGGLELAMAAHYRICSSTTRLALPEVTLGILPGAGGTQRLPRLIGMAAALDMMLTGAALPAAKAQSLGLIDQIATGDLLEHALHLAATHPAPRPTSAQPVVNADDGAQVIAKARAALPARARAVTAPNAILDCAATTLTTPFETGMQIEASAFAKCLQSPERAGLIHAFFAERASAKLPQSSRTPPRPLHQLGVVGGGTMGAGIAVAALDAGFDVTMVERDSVSMVRGRANVEAVYDRLITKNRLSLAAKAETLGRFHTTTAYADLANADLVIEAVFEDLAIKRAVFENLDRVLRPDAVLASNTSFLDIDQIAATTSRARNVLGLHFFSPANIMKLLEIVVPSAAADDTVATGFAFAKRLGKVAVRAANSDGFIGNRILNAYAEAASFMVEDGASPYDIDAAIVGFGFPIGLYAMFDLAGNDIVWADRKRRMATRPPGARYADFADLLCEQGWFGQKTGQGFYTYGPDSRQGTPDPQVLALIAASRSAKAIVPRTFGPDEILQRYLAAMVNEAARLLAEGVALKPSDIDVTFVHGYGFPRHRGGPMHFADSYGLAKMLADIRRFEHEDPVFWAPAPLLVDLVTRGATFASLNPPRD